MHNYTLAQIKKDGATLPLIHIDPKVFRQLNQMIQLSEIRAKENKRIDWNKLRNTQITL